MDERFYNLGQWTYKQFGATIFDMKLIGNNIYLLGIPNDDVKFTNTINAKDPIKPLSVFLLSVTKNCIFNNVQKIGNNLQTITNGKIINYTDLKIGIVVSIPNLLYNLDFDPSINEVIIRTNSANGVIAKVTYDLQGNFINAKTIIEQNAILIKNYSVEIDKNENLYLTGTFGGTLDYDPDINNNKSLISKSYDIFIAKYKTDGGFDFVKQIGDSKNEIAKDIKIISNKCFIVGGFGFAEQSTYDTGSTVDFDIDPITIFNLVHSKDLLNPQGFVLKLNLCPTTQFVNAGIDKTICNGQSVTLKATGATSYSWNNSITNNVAFSPNSSKTYTVTGTDINGCQNTDNVIVTVNTLPTINAGADQTICNGQSVTLNATGATSYSWNNSINNNVAFSPTLTKKYTVTGTDANGCQDSDTVHVTVNPTSSSQNTKTSNNNYVWNNQTYTQSGVYTQILKNKYGCDSTVTLNLTITSVNTTGIKEILVSKIKIYPNPANNNITIDYDDQIEKVEILDLKGAIVYSSIEPKNELNLPQNIQTGYYTVVIQTAEGIVRKELMIQK